MAHLNRDRGQIILLAAFALGVTFIALALVVNSAIFTENLAARGETTGANDALEYRHEIEENVGALLDSVNDVDSPALSLVKENVSEISAMGGLQHAAYGRVVTVSVVDGSEVRGDELLQAAATAENFTNDTGQSTWRLAENVEDAREVTFDITGDLEDDEDDAFRMAVNGSDGDWWNLSVHEDGSDVVVTVSRGDGTENACRRAAPSGAVTIDVTGGEVAGEPCHALRWSGGNRMWFAEGAEPPYDIWFVNGDEARGNYSMVVGDDAAPVFTNFDDDTTMEVRTDVFYSVEVTYTYQTTRLTYETDIRVAPGETDD